MSTIARSSAPAMVCIKPVMHIMDKQIVRAPRRRREHSAELKRELVTRSLEPGVSVAAIAMDSGINANLLFGWRRKHLESIAQREPAPARSPAAVLLPVSVEASQCEIRGTPPASPTRSSRGTTELEIGSARVRLRGPVDDASRRSVLMALRSLA
jgi:transposase